VSAEITIPKHIAIIMDGNGRWAESKGWTRIQGHREGARRVDEIVTACCELGVEHLTLYAFSTENWKRPALEVRLLWRLLVQHLRSMDKKLIRNKISLSAKGSLGRLPESVTQELNRVIRDTFLDQPKMRLTLCLSYGGRQEILDATQRLMELARDGKCDPADLTEGVFQQYLYQPDVADPDLLIRTGGEYRVSNFLLWEIAYSEMVVVPCLWPEFSEKRLKECLHEFSMRSRRFGMTGDQVLSLSQGSGRVAQ